MSTVLNQKHQIDKIYHHKCKILNRNWRMLPTSKSYAKFRFMELFVVVLDHTLFPYAPCCAC